MVMATVGKTGGSARAQVQRARLMLRAKIADSKERRMKLADAEKAMRAQLRRTR